MRIPIKYYQEVTNTTYIDNHGLVGHLENHEFINNLGDYELANIGGRLYMLMVLNNE